LFNFSHFYVILVGVLIKALLLWHTIRNFVMEEDSPFKFTLLEHQLPTLCNKDFKVYLEKWYDVLYEKCQESIFLHLVELLNVLSERFYYTFF